MELGVLLLLPLCFPGFQAQTSDSEERLSEGSTLHVQCPYTAGVTYQQQKVWCRVSNNKYEPLVETSRPTEYSYRNQATNGKVTIEDDSMRKTVSITMTNLQAEDSGTYVCAFLYYSSYSYYLLKMISLSVFKELHKSELETVSVQCKYSALVHSTDVKFWCQEGQTGCKVLVRTDYPSAQGNSKALEHRTVIQDDTQRRTVTITMQKLQAQDTGVYWCAFYRGAHTIQIMEARVSVFKRTQQHTAKKSGNFSVQCSYNALEYGAARKAWCKEVAEKPCTILITTDLKPSGYPRTFQQGRLTIQDDTQKGVVTITIRELQAQDSGVYLCALYEHGYIFRMEEVTLNISDKSAGTTLSGTAGTSQATPSGDDPKLSSNANFFILLYGVLSILLILALISLITLCIRQHKQLKRKGNGQADHIYEKPEDTAQLDSTERLESPKDDSKDLKYVTLNFKSKIILQDPLYCNVEPSQAHMKPKDENVEYAIIAVKQ
ncbi:polymeric immunoglobulin receptor [Tyto alba]|uniref:polymeric immunoglobulin receptor n=1 Tax=Tyto alba TaxID=56313 RepID=UPI001C681906|nr:polymeric immunoglobulin receptor [Tyto alba]